jgi:GNAT superfamily N-acetyltransferase
MRIDLHATDELTEADRAALEVLNRLANPPGQDASARLTWAGPEDGLYTVRVWDEQDRLVSSASVCQRIISLNDQPLCAGGIRQVMTHADARRQGYGRAAVQTATDVIWRHVAPDLALLLSSAMAVPFYLSLGWQIFDGVVLCAQPEGLINYTQLRPTQPAMIRLPDNVPPPRGTIDLCGLPW